MLEHVGFQRFDEQNNKMTQRDKKHVKSWRTNGSVWPSVDSGGGAEWLVDIGTTKDAPTPDEVQASTRRQYYNICIQHY